MTLGRKSGNLSDETGVVVSMLVRAALVALVACGACTSGDDRDVSRTAPARPATTATADAELRSVLRDYFGCLRDEGIEVADPSFDDGGNIESWPSYEPTDEARAAEEACSEDLTEIAFRPRGEAAIFLERAGQFAECMADHGVPDVEVSLEGIRIGPRSGNRAIRAAERECRHFVEER